MAGCRRRRRRPGPCRHGPALHRRRREQRRALDCKPCSFIAGLAGAAGDSCSGRQGVARGVAVPGRWVQAAWGITSAVVAPRVVRRGQVVHVLGAGHKVWFHLRCSTRGTARVHQGWWQVHTSRRAAGAAAWRAGHEAVQPSCNVLAPGQQAALRRQRSGIAAVPLTHLQQALVAAGAGQVVGGAAGALEAAQRGTLPAKWRQQS